KSFQEERKRKLSAAAVEFNFAAAAAGTMVAGGGRGVPLGASTSSTGKIYAGTSTSFPTPCTVPKVVVSVLPAGSAAA
ncbi:unnamed protein product, partial [Amoebophrya sp. A120]